MAAFIPKIELSAREVERRLMRYFKDLAAQVERNCRKFCPHMPCLRIKVEGKSVDFEVSNLGRPKCQCGFMGVRKRTVVMKCEEGRRRLGEVKAVYKYYKGKYGDQIKEPDEIYEKFDQFVREIYSRLNIEEQI